MGKLFNIKEKLWEHYYVDQIDAIYTWIQKENSISNSTVLILLPNLTIHTNVHKKHSDDYSNIGYIVCSSGMRETAFNEAKETKGTKWQQTFNSPFFEIWENSAIYKNEQLPIRFGLNDSEQSFLIKNVRSYLTYIIAETAVPNTPLIAMSPRFLLPTDIDVGLWVGGKLRGSTIITNEPLINGVKTAAYLASRDLRFKPIAKDEIPLLTVEISIISSLHLPLTIQEMKNDEIYPDKTYRLETREPKNVGWYLPMVYNSRFFNNLKELLESLALEKLRPVKQTLLSPTISETWGFISLHKAPDLIKKLNGAQILPDDNKKITELQTDSLKYLKSIQETDGNLPAIINPISGQIKDFDLIRLAHATWALYDYSLKNSATEAGLIADKSYYYLNNLIQRHNYLKYLPTYQKNLSLIYLERASKLKDETKTFINASEYPSISSLGINNDPITILQLAQNLIDRNTDYEMAETIVLKVLEDFEMKITAQIPIELALYIDLIPCLILLSAKLNKPNLRKSAEDIIDWYMTKQLETGAFPNTDTSRYSYTRGTLKILETLSRTSLPLSLKYNPLPWLSLMQYREETNYFTSSELSRKIDGGLRHDAHNGSIWIDSISHLLLIEKNSPIFTS